MDMTYDINPNKKTERDPRRLLNFTFKIISEADNVELAMNQIFTEIGKYLDLSRITIFENDTMSQQAKVSYEWLSLGISSCNYDNFKRSESGAQEYEHRLLSTGIYVCNDVSKENVSLELEDFYSSLETKAVIQCAIYDNNQFIGSANFEDCIKPREWTKPEIDTLYYITKVISNYILQLRSKEELKNEIFFTQAMLNNQKLSNYAIKQDTYELVYMSKYTGNLFPNVKLGELCYKAIFGRNKPCITCPLKGLNDKNIRYSVEAYNEKLDAWLSTTATTVAMPDGQKMNLICLSDVTGFMERVKSKDILTGLMTLPKFEAEAMKLIASAKNIYYVIIYSDFDKFKFINDEWGYSLGNEILKYYAERVSRLLSSSELFCRVSSDKFITLLSYRNTEDILERIKMINNIIKKDFKERFPEVKPIIISGVYFMTTEDKVLSIALDKANIARKRIKGYHKSHYAIYDDSLHKEISKEKLIENRMYDALNNGEFTVFLQPKINLNTLEISGAEALVRWKTGDGKIMSPMEFIPIFEKNGFVIELDFYVYEEAFKSLRKCLDLGKKPLVISINVSRLHIDEMNFIDRIDHLVKKYQLPSNLIEIEITESVFLKGLDRLLTVINALREKGFLVSIDDFGAGYSSLNLLKTLPVDILKIDKEFFMSNTMEDKDKIVIDSIIKLAKGLGLKVISEGVETIEQARFLKECSCDMVQGYFFYKPLPIEEFEELIK
jgi:diguanylate cyclase (GGDEF)-like protein